MAAGDVGEHSNCQSHSFFFASSFQGLVKATACEWCPLNGSDTEGVGFGVFGSGVVFRHFEPTLHSNCWM